MCKETLTGGGGQVESGGAGFSVRGG